MLRTRRTIDPAYSSQVLDRVVQILGCFTQERPRLRLGDLAAASGLHRSTVYRLIEAMRHHQFVMLDDTSGEYHVGIRLFELGAVAAAGCEYDRYARSALEELAQATSETAHLCVLNGADVVYIAKVESSLQLRMALVVGGRHPAYCTSAGKAILAYLEPEQLAAYLGETEFRALTTKTITSASRLKAQLNQVAAQGYAIDDEELQEDVRCIAAPIRDYSGAPVAGVSIAGPASRVTRSRIPELAQHVMRAAAEISSRLGYRSRNAAQTSEPTTARAKRTASGSRG